MALGVPYPKLTIPTRLATILDADLALRDGVDDVLSRVSSWLHVSRLPFFPEYTEHGLSHLAQVLRTCDELIDDQSLRLLTASDIATLSVAVVLHDLAMHLEKDGFLRLVAPDSEYRPVAHFEDVPWPEIWERFRVEALRFDPATNRRLFGTPEPVRPPDATTSDWTENQFRLTGEFIRRHHMRLAHEIALYGFPGTTDAPPVLLHNAALLGPLMDVAGVVARSHGTSMRPCLDYLARTEQSHRHRAAAYLMALLRIADYLQLDADRAASMMLRVRTLRSPLSRDEWRKHQAVVRLHFEAADPEAVHVELALPEDVQTYLGVQSTLDSLQAELDSTWAVLGESYGRDAKYSTLRLRIRRVRSDLSLSSFTARLPYLPVEARFRAADATLLSLLVGPLYGGHVEFGVRELVQNAVDAVRELGAWCARRGTERAHQLLTDQISDVIVTFEDHGDSGVLIISDRGIGMTAATVQHYFLNAGASFRASDTWMREFAADDGKAQVLRSGRFGVGSLAAFLLGPEIHVSTRHVAEPEGLEFSATLETSLIQLARVERPVGTTIRIRLAGEALQALRAEEAWDFYCLEYPSVMRVLKTRDAQPRVLPQKFTFPLDEEVLPETWRRASVSHGQMLCWDVGAGSPQVCNGLFIGAPGASERKRSRTADTTEPVSYSLPRLSARDMDGFIPLNLARTDVHWDSWSGLEDLRREIVRDFLAFTLVAAPTAPCDGPKQANEWLRTTQYGALEGVHGSLWVSTHDGVTLLGPWFFHELAVSRLLVLACEGDYPRAQSEIETTFGALSPFAILAAPDRPNGVHPVDPKWAEKLRLCVGGMRRLVGDVRDVGTFWSVEESGDAHAPSVDFKRIMKHVPDAFDILGGTPLVELYLRPVIEPALGPLASAWYEYFGSACIPYDPAERRRRLSRAYRDLKPYIDAWERLFQAGWLPM